MSIQKSTSQMTGVFSKPFSNGRYTKFASGGCQYFISLEQDQSIPFDLEVRAEFVLEHQTIVERDKNGDPQPAGVLKPVRFVGVVGDKK